MISSGIKTPPPFPVKKRRFAALCALALAAGAMSLLTGCEEMNTTSTHGAYNVVAYKPHDPSAVRVKVSLSKQIIYVMEGNKPLLVAATTVGVPTHPTPKGNFHILSKNARKRSGVYGYLQNGNEIHEAKIGSGPGKYTGYPMQDWCEFSPGYGFHQGDIWPVPRSHGCLHVHKNVVAKFFALVKVGTPVNIEDSQPEDATIGANVPRPTDFRDPDPPAPFMISDRVFDSMPTGELVPY